MTDVKGYSQHQEKNGQDGFCNEPDDGSNDNVEGILNPSSSGADEITPRESIFNNQPDTGESDCDSFN